MPNLTPIEVTGRARWGIFAATSADGQWEYREVSGSLWSVTHVPTGRRYWVAGLEEARAETGNGTAARFLDVGKPLPSGKPLTKGEHRAITVELSVRDCQRMLTDLNAEVPYMVTSAWRDVCPAAVPGLPVDARTLANVLGNIYGGEPYAWVDALRAVRPDLIPPHLDRQPA